MTLDMNKFICSTGNLVVKQLRMSPQYTILCTKNISFFLNSIRFKFLNSFVICHHFQDGLYLSGKWVLFYDETLYINTLNITILEQVKLCV